MQDHQAKTCKDNAYRLLTIIVVLALGTIESDETFAVKMA
jgi:hypothetical protein